jgi:uncharacterized membrane protein YeaQ/YmgE (transglycosylase-associated protein family)
MANFMADHGWLWWILAGLLAGAIAKLIIPGRQGGGCLMTLLLGLAGAVLAGWLGQKYGYYEAGQGAGFLAAILGAVVILIIYQLIMAVVNRSR